MRKLVEAVLRTIAFYTFAGWVYIVVNSEVHPSTLRLQLTHFAKWPHEDTFGEICFAISFLSAIAWQAIRASRETIP